MDIRKRLRISILLQKLEKNKEYAKKVGIEDKSHIMTEQGQKHHTYAYKVLKLFIKTIVSVLFNLYILHVNHALPCHLVGFVGLLTPTYKCNDI